MNCMFVVTHKEIDKKLLPNYDFFYVNSVLNHFEDKKFNDAMYIDNISTKNYSFCELTALYEFAKLSNFFENIGLSHYRRFFAGSLIDLLKDKPISVKKLNRFLKNKDIILPNCIRLDNNVYEHFDKHHYIKDLEVMANVTIKLYPEYEKELRKFFGMKKMVCFNMFYCSANLMQKYISWLFPILFELENKIDISSYDPYQKRLFGFLAERLFNVWLLKNKPRAKYLYINNTSVNAIHKIMPFFKQTIFKRKYRLY